MPELIGIGLRQCRPWIPLHALPRGLRHWRGEQRRIDDHSLGLEELRAPNAQRGRDVPSPLDEARWVVPRVYM